ncbi:hypothetical protein FHX74_000576 [Friedmanniella endophytica]|uniref:Uncharacterized protein n=1 Tax=Microlunatus kandeliicorticis TaxID=1759536 RepID=A0A7W3IPQ6_9ACTN|nr:hypothetical protein [Microlunatus kandeliicorticis]MBA8792982.1 hypothetical protein [Microlunatus kandeliicorticis]
MDAEFSRDHQAQQELRARADLITAQQQIIVDLLEEMHDRPPPAIEQALRDRLTESGLPDAPRAWISAVASEIADDRLYVVAPGSVSGGAFSNAAADRARERLERRADPSVNPVEHTPKL